MLLKAEQKNFLNKMKKYKAFIFDMDGVIFDNNEYHKKAFDVFCEKYQYPLTDEDFNTNIVGRTNEMIMAYLFGDKLSTEEINQFAEEKESIFRELYRPNVKPTAGLPFFLEKAKANNIVCGVGSNAPQANIDFMIETTGFGQYFSVLVNASMVEKGKPAPDVYLKVASLLGVDPSDCVIFEDSPTGVKAGNAAGIDVVGVLSTHTLEELGTDNCVDFITTFEESENFIKSVFN